MTYLKRNYTGIINLVEKDNRLEYRLFSKTETDVNNLQVDYIFSEFYMSYQKINIKIHVDNMLIFNESGTLCKQVKFGNEEWFIKNESTGREKCIGDVLFENCDKKGLIVIQKL